MVDLGVLAKKSRYFRVRFKYALHNYLPVGAPFSRDTYVNIIRFLHGEAHRWRAGGSWSARPRIWMLPW